MCKFETSVVQEWEFSIEAAYLQGRDDKTG